MRKALNQLGAIVVLFALPVVAVAIPWGPQDSAQLAAQVVVSLAVMGAALGILVELFVGAPYYDQ